MLATPARGLATSTSGRALSFSGGGLVAAAYHLGVFEGLSAKSQTQLDLHNGPLVGASAGALVCAVLAAGCHYDDAVNSLGRIVDSVRAARAGPLSCDILRLVRPELEGLLPEDAHQSCSGRAVIFVTDVSTRPWLPVLLSEWDSRSALIDSILTSSYIPGITSRRSPVGGGPLIDGGFSGSNFPVHPTAAQTVRVSPFSAGELDICPEVRTTSKPRSVMLPSKVSLDVTRANASAIRATLWPPRDVTWLHSQLELGFNDACRWLKKQ